jgi:hypothetical protein
MSTPTVTPDQGAPNVQMPGPDSSVLSGIVGNPSPQMPTLAPQPSRLLSILQAVAHVGSVAASGLPSQGRPGFVSGLGQGARAEQADQANQQAIKFANFQDQVRIANLHAQDLAKQQADANTQKAQQAAEDFQREAFETAGGNYDTHPNNGTAVAQTLQAQTQANGAASIAPGTHISSNGTDILIPSDKPETLAAQVQNYKSLQGVLPGLPTLPPFDPNSVKTTADVANARQNLGQHLDIMQHLLQGYDVGGAPLNHDALNNLIPAYQAQIDSLSKSGNATPYQLGTLKNTLAILQANEQNHTDAEKKAFAAQTPLIASRAGATASATLPTKEALQDNAAANKPQKPQNTDSNGNPVWVPGATTMQKNKAGLAENMVFNSNNVASILLRRPDIVGAVAGRFTTLDQMKGTNDPDIVSLATDIENIAKANAGLHGQKAQEAVTQYENTVLNHFKNGVAGIFGGLKSSTDSVQTFIDEARPETYRTHSKQGGAVRAMVPQQGGQ